MSNLKNDTRRDDFLKSVGEWGRDKAKGDDSMVKVAVGVCKGVQEGFLSLDKDSDGVTDLHRVYDKYGQAKSKRITADKKKESDNSYKAQLSKLKNFFDLGALNVKGIDGYALCDNAIRIHKERVEQGLNVKGAYTALVDVARAQKASDTQLTDEQIIAAITPKDGAEKTAFTVLRGAHRTIERLITGEAGVSFDCDDDIKSKVIGIEEELRGMLALMTSRDEAKAKAAKLIELAAELGMELTPTPVPAAA